MEERAWAMAKGFLSLEGVGVGVEPARVESMFALQAMAGREERKRAAVIVGFMRGWRAHERWQWQIEMGGAAA